MTSDVEAHLETITPAVRHRDAESLLALMRRATGEEPRLWGTVIGFGTYHYRYPSGREGDGPAAAFAARKAATVVYVVDGVGAHADLLERLGPHTTGVGCLYLEHLAQVDQDVLEAVVARSYASPTAGTYGSGARDSG